MPRHPNWKKLAQLFLMKMLLMIPPQEEETDVKPKPSSALKVPRKYRASTDTCQLRGSATIKENDKISQEYKSI
ncbi:hypothetical protein PCANC_01599 [Puccinia coronata f. sp. avenae]|uniref:Uncharacterized protein n=1 Tax=Puccinia coronata f. sp. avenae TaxID=200324 RepID=A0A2N5W0K8_9BASI|nr:hypothetical protein PCASD_06449 [Puccinia coronata f. sp. avenae]PLW55798.1 hypothetical protein PCANC_01599 [Puccinia coronata f. sp. avenae]